MKAWVLIPLTLSALLCGLGVGLDDGNPRTEAITTPLVVLGGATAAVTVTLWAAAALGLARGVPVRADALGRLTALAALLADHARAAEASGVLVLMDRPCPPHGHLFREGVRLLVAAAPEDQLRRDLASLASSGLSAEDARRRAVLALLRFVPVLALGMGLATAVWMMASLAWPARPTPFTPLALLIALYACFAVAAISQEAADRLGEAAHEAELGAALVIQTLTDLRAGVPAAEVPARLDALLQPAQSPAAPAAQGPLRRAA